MNKIRIIIFAVLAIFFVSVNAFGYTAGAVYNWDASSAGYNPSAVLHAGTINTSNLIFGDYIGKKFSFIIIPDIHCASPNYFGELGYLYF